MKNKYTLGVFCVSLIMILAACRSQSASMRTQEVRITLLDSKVVSSAMTFSPAIPCHFIVINHAKIPQIFTIMSSAMKTMAMSGMSMSDFDKMALISIDHLNPGETKVFDYTFPSSEAGSEPEFVSYPQGNDKAELKLDVRVRK